jgi:hypothetical protein
MDNDENVLPEEEQREHSTFQRLFVALLKDKKVIYPVISAQFKEKWPEVKPPSWSEV